MLEDAAENVKRYAPPPQRSRVLNRRKSGGHREAGNNNVRNENSQSGLIFIDGCRSSAAAQLLTERWAAAMNSCDDASIDLSERAFMYTGVGGPSWGLLKLPHQMDFSAELRRAIYNASAFTGPAVGNNHH